MEKYPDYVRLQARPLVFITGSVDNEPDLHLKLIRSLEAYQKDSEAKENCQLLFRSVSIDTTYPAKKPPKEAPSLDGILKNDWMSKHFNAIPSVIVFCVPFSVDWSAIEWNRREIVAHERLHKFKVSLGARDVRVIVLMVRVGSGAMEKDVMDERIASFRRQAQTDSKSFVFLTPTEAVQTDSNSVMRRVFKSVREFSHSYYSANIKKFKTMEKSIGEKFKGVAECILLARFNFKIAFMNEFHNQPSYSLRYYRQAYHALAASIELIDRDMYDQVKSVAEIAHFKLCSILFSMQSIDEALQQCKSHLFNFAKLPCPMQWKHFAWVSDQYIVFCELLDDFGVKEDVFPLADRTSFLQNAARFTAKRELSFNKVRQEVADRIQANSSLSAFVESRSDGAFRGMHISPPRYFGASPQFLDPLIGQFHVNQEESNRLYTEYLEEQEMSVNHHADTLDLLKQAVERLNPTHQRRRAALLTLVAQEDIRGGDVEGALSHLHSAASFVGSEDWSLPSAAVWKLVLDCAADLARPTDMVHAALCLYSRSRECALSAADIRELHLNLLAVFAATLFPPRESDLSFVSACPLLSNPGAFAAHESFKPLIARENFGRRANTAVLQGLPMGFVVQITRENPLFAISCQYSQPVVELGQRLSIRVSIANKLVDDLRFDEIQFHFAENSFVKTFLDSSGPSQAGDKDVADLRLVAQRSNTFEFSVEATEDAFSRFLTPDNVFFLKNVELIWYSRLEDDEGKRKRGISFSVHAFPSVVQRVQKLPGKAVAAKDCFLFCPREDPSFVVVHKPTELLRVVAPTGPVSLLEGALQRVDVVCQVGKYSISHAKIYLSSDKEVSSAEGSGDDAIFWSPDAQQLLEERSAESEAVAFRPFVLNSSQQPAAPLLLSRPLPAHSFFVVPLFFRVKRHEKAVINVKLSVDFVPLGVMKSSIVKDLTLQLRPVHAMSVRYTVAALDNRDQYGLSSTAVLPKSKNVLSAHLKCAPLLSVPSLTIDSARIQSAPHAGEQAVQFLSCNEAADTLENHVLKANEEFVCAKTMELSGDTTGKAVSASPGFFEVKWRITDSDPLRFQAVDLSSFAKQPEAPENAIVHCGLFGDGEHPFSWLLYGSSLEDVRRGADRGTVVSESVSVFSQAVTKFPIPNLQIDKTPFDIAMDLPAVVNVGDEFDLRFKMKNFSGSIEKINMLVMLSEYFLLSGSTSTVFEIGAGKYEIMSLRAVALTAGKLPLPRLILHWEVRGGHPMKIFDMGEKDGDRQTLFVRPVTSNVLL